MCVTSREPGSPVGAARLLPGLSCRAQALYHLETAWDPKEIWFTWVTSVSINGVWN